MKQLIIVFLLASLASCNGTDSIQKAPKKTLEGIWLYPVADELNVLYFQKTKVKIYRVDNFREYNYRLNTKVLPHKIDFISTLDSNYSIKGVFEIDGEKLKIKLNTQLSLNAKRPTSIKGMNVGYFTKSDWNNEVFQNFYEKKNHPKYIQIMNLTNELRTDSLNIRKLVQRSFLYTETNQYSKASSDLVKALALNKYTFPKWQMWQYLARSYANESKDSLSHLYLDSLIHKFPHQGEAYHQKGLLFCKNGEVEKGCLLFDMALQKGMFESEISVLKSEFCK